MLRLQNRDKLQIPDPVELTEVQTSLISGGIMCSRDPATQFIMVAVMPFAVSQNGPFLCVG